VEKRKEPDKTRVPPVGESGELDEPSEAELIELATSGSIEADRILIQDSQGREYRFNGSRKGALGR
jgi:hypothetical protein